MPVNVGGWRDATAKWNKKRDNLIVTKASSDEGFIFKNTRKAFCRLSPVYGSHCGGNKLGIMELVCLLRQINHQSILGAYDCFNGIAW